VAASLGRACPDVRAARGVVRVDDIENELVPAKDRPALPDVVERQMLAAAQHWERYYPGSPMQRRIARRYSYSDRMRYYWPDPQIDAAVQQLLRNLSAHPIPEPMLSAFLPDQYARVRDGALSAVPKAIVLDRVRCVLEAYAQACRAPLAGSVN
jgi:D-tagatose-1,6-bisphosphate aldolase subunit GatZ/KbaZ